MRNVNIDRREAFGWLEIFEGQITSCTNMEYQLLILHVLMGISVRSIWV